MNEIKILNTQLSLDDCYNAVRTDSAGGICVFVGTVRNQTKDNKVLHLDFEAYESMAIKELSKIADAISEKWKIEKLCIHHGVGKLQVGDIAVIIAISSAHRKASFKACQYAIDTLKQTVPIWKKEFFEDGAIWVSAHP